MKHFKREREREREKGCTPENEFLFNKQWHGTVMLGFYVWSSSSEGNVCVQDDRASEKEKERENKTKIKGE